LAVIGYKPIYISSEIDSLLIGADNMVTKESCEKKGMDFNPRQNKCTPREKLSSGAKGLLLGVMFALFAIVALAIYVLNNDTTTRSFIGGGTLINYFSIILIILGFIGAIGAVITILLVPPPGKILVLIALLALSVILGGVTFILFIVPGFPILTIIAGILTLMSLVAFVVALVIPAPIKIVAAIILVLSVGAIILGIFIRLFTSLI